MPRHFLAKGDGQGIPEHAIEPRGVDVLDDVRQIIDESWILQASRNNPAATDVPPLGIPGTTKHPVEVSGFDLIIRALFRGQITTSSPILANGLGASGRP